MTDKEKGLTRIRMTGRRKSGSKIQDHRMEAILTKEEKEKRGRTKAKEEKGQTKGNATYDNSPMLNFVSVTPFACSRARRTSSGVVIYPGAEIRSDCVKKLYATPTVCRV